MNRLLTYLILLIVAAGCGGEESNKNNKEFQRAKKSIREFAESHFDSTYIIMEGSVGSLNRIDPPLETNDFLGSDTLENNFKIIYFEQRHLGVPIKKDSLLSNYSWTYYQLDENFEVVSYSTHSINKLK